MNNTINSTDIRVFEPFVGLREIKLGTTESASKSVTNRKDNKFIGSFAQ